MKKIGLIMRKGYTIHEDHIETLNRFCSGVYCITSISEANLDSRFSECLLINDFESENETFERIITFAKAHQIEGFITFQETDIIFTSICNQKIGNSILANFDASVICRDKAKQRNFLKEYAIPHPDFHIVYNKEDIKKHSLKFPLIIKPTTAASSSHVYLVANQDELESKYNKIVSETNKYYYQSSAVHIILEEFLPGNEYTLDGIVKNGAFILGGIHSKDCVSGPNFEENNYYLPFKGNENELVQIANSIVSRLKLNTSLFNVELRRDRNNRLKVVEFSNRISGGHVYRNIREVYTIDLVAAYVAAALGYSDDIFNMFSYRSSPRCQTNIRFIYKNGLINENNAENIRQHVHFGAYYPTAPKGAKIKKAPYGFDIAGLLSSRCKLNTSDKEFIKICNQLENSLNLKVTEAVK